MQSHHDGCVILLHASHHYTVLWEQLPLKKKKNTPIKSNHITCDSAVPLNQKSSHYSIFLRIESADPRNYCNFNEKFMDSMYSEKLGFSIFSSLNNRALERIASKIWSTTVGYRSINETNHTQQKERAHLFFQRAAYDCYREVSPISYKQTDNLKEQSLNIRKW